MAVITRPYYSAGRLGSAPKTVNYVFADGHVETAQVTGRGGDTGAFQLNLRLMSHRGANRVKTNVPRRTAMNQTNVWF